MTAAESSGSRIRADFYALAVNFLFVIIVAYGLAGAEGVLFPIQDVFSDENRQKSAPLFLSYAVIISGWVGYTRSMSIMPHKDNYKGVLRFVVDLAILFGYFYLLGISTTEYFEVQFHWTLLGIFVAYLIWELVRYYEYRDSADREKLRGRIAKTSGFLAACAAVGAVYHTLIVVGTVDVGIPVGDGALLLFMAIMVVIVIAYRVSKRQMTGYSKYNP